MHLDDTPIKIITEIIVLGKLLKEVVWSKPVRGIAKSLLKKTEILWYHSRNFFLKKSESRRRPSLTVRVLKKSSGGILPFQALQKKLA